ncbi:MAG: BACON domain-containing protein [Bacteroidales bacterium]|nr:BACON domain-containing protein [Candidatus Cryptobacteroides fimicaballi]
MKIVKIISALAAVCALVIGCAKETPNVWNEIQVSSSYVGIPTAGGSKTITVTATDSWSINMVPNWLTVSPTVGSAGETVVTFTASKALSNNENTIKIVCAGKEQTIIVRQDAEYVEPKVLTIDEALEVIAQYPDGSPTCRVKGIVCKITEISPSYGNATYYLSEDGKYDSNGKWLQVYRGLWLDGAAFKTGNEFAVGDEITIEGNLMSYKGTPETVEKNSYVIKHNPSLIKCDSLVVDGVKSSLLPIEGGQIDAVLTCKGDGITVSIPDDAKSWLSVSGIKTSGTVATVSLTAAQNAGGDRSTEVTFSTTSNGKSYTAVAALSQTGAIIECSIAEYLAAPEDQTQYRISGIITRVVQDSEQYGANLYIKDATGEVYVYGTTDNNGTIQTLAAFGAKDGDIIEFVGTRSSYKGTPQMAKGKFQWYKSVTVKTAAEADALADDDTNDPKNYIKITGTVTKPEKSLLDAGTKKWDLTKYGNFDLVDETGTIYVYGVTAGWKGAKGTGAIATNGVEEGDKLTIVAYKTSYKGMNQLVGMYVSHEKGQVTPPAPTGENVVLTFPDDNSENNKVGSYTDTWTAKIGEQEFTIANFNNNNWNNWSFIKCGRKANESTASITTTIADKISKVTVNFDNITAADVTSATLYVGTTAVTASELKAGDVDFVVAAPAENQTYKLEFVCKVSSENKNGFVVIKKIEYVVAE